jgi:Rrf2 family transcriptional regulator, nitric oxide-sensitive transcriptional repressor
MNIAHISEAALIALHAAGAVACKNGEPVTAGSIARLIDASENHIAKVMQRLVKGGLLNSARGPSGGFTLKKNPGKITLFDIFKLIEGNAKNEGCPFHRRQCVFKECIFGGFLDRMEDEFKAHMKSKTLADFKEA